MMVSWVHALSVHNHWIGQWCGNGNEPASTLRHLAVATSCRHTSGVDWRFLNVRAARKRLWIWLQTELHTACRGLTAGYSMVKKAYPDSSNWNSFLRCRFQWQQQYWCRVLQLRMGEDCRSAAFGTPECANKPWGKLLENFSPAVFRSQVEYQVHCSWPVLSLLSHIQRYIRRCNYFSFIVDRPNYIQQTFK